MWIDNIIDENTMDPETAAIEEERAKQIRLAVRLAVERLPAQQKKVIQLRYYEEMTSNEEVAERIGRTANTVKTHIIQAKRRLLTLLSSAEAMLSLPPAEALALRLNLEGITHKKIVEVAEAMLSLPPAEALALVLNLEGKTAEAFALRLNLEGKTREEMAEAMGNVNTTAAVKLQIKKAKERLFKMLTAEGSHD